MDGKWLATCIGVALLTGCRRRGDAGPLPPAGQGLDAISAGVVTGDAGAASVTTTMPGMPMQCLN